jgi:hypothetical protein
VLGAAFGAAVLSGSFACIEPITLEPETTPGEVGVGETRTIELRHVRLDVEGFGKAVTLEQLRALPSSVLDGVWLLDMELRGLVENTLGLLRDLPTAEAADLPQAAQNMRTLLRTTPDNVELEGTNLEELIGLSAAIGIPAARALADILQVGITENIIPIESAAKITVSGLIGSHPAAQFRDGPVDEMHPDGQWPVAENSIPITLGDVVNNFEDLPQRFGPTMLTNGTMHPGFIEEASGFSVIEDEFEMTMRVNANALPYKGADLTNVSEATVNSLGAQIDTLFDTDDPDWLTVEGLVDDPFIERMTVTMIENDSFIPGGTARVDPKGDSPVWDLPPWEFERLVAEMSFDASQSLVANCVSFSLGTGIEAFRSCVEADAWVTFETFNQVGNPPAPAYMWDLQLELAEVRLHDGGLAEGEADVQFTLDDVPLGVGADAITQEIRDNIAANPEALRQLASQLADATDGEADFFYIRSKPGGPADLEGDWLYFVTEDDIPIGDDGDPVRPYEYANPGFFGDMGLSDKLSATTAHEGDDGHEKLRVMPGDSVYLQDDAARVYRIDVGEKGSPNKLTLDVTRVQ